MRAPLERYCPLISGAKGAVTAAAKHGVKTEGNSAAATPREILIGLAYIGQMIDLGDRDLQPTGIDQAGKF